MLKLIFWNKESDAKKKTLLQRPATNSSEEQIAKVSKLLKEVQLYGDKAVFALTKLFDKVDLENLVVTEKEYQEADKQVPRELKQAFEVVIANLTKFHQLQKAENYSVETAPGIVCERRVLPIQAVGLYVPAGTAPLVSTVLMLGVPSKLAINPLRVLCSPPNLFGKIDPNILVAAKLCGIENIFKIGGVQAIASMAYGTESIPKVNKIFGPGNSWVTIAKSLVALDPNGAAIDMPAGPSEVMVIADDEANPAFIAADLLSQAEHGEDSQVILVCLSETFAKAVSKELELQLKILSRVQIMKSSLQASLAIIVENPLTAIDVANAYAPEHLILHLTNPRSYLPLIYTSGSIFLGPFSPEAAGDYASGTNHVLPTQGFAKSYSGLSVQDFMRTLSVQELTKQGLRALAPTIHTLTDIEGLDAHKLAIDVRLNQKEL